MINDLPLSTQMNATGGASSSLGAYIDTGAVNYWRLLALLEARGVLPERLDSKAVEEILRDLNFKDGATCQKSLYQDIGFREFIETMMMVGIAVSGPAQCAVDWFRLGWMVIPILALVM